MEEQYLIPSFIYQYKKSWLGFIWQHMFINFSYSFLKKLKIPLCVSPVVQQLQHELDLQSTKLLPSDCLSIGNFLAHTCHTANHEFKVKLQHCSIDDKLKDCKYLVSDLHKCLLDMYTHGAVITLLAIDMETNAIQHDGVHHLSTLLKIGCVSELNLSHNCVSDPEQDDTVFAEFTVQLKQNTTLKKLQLKECGLTSLDAKAAMQNNLIPVSQYTVL